MDATLVGKKQFFGKRDIWITCAILVLTSLIIWASRLNLGPDNYEDCVLQSLVAGDSDSAAKIKSAACLRKFPRNPYDVFDK